jgi:DNA helicase-2/ATP-dependent DNA helicase PcrA
VTLPTGAAAETDVVLACEWNDLWAAGPEVLPIAFKPQPGNFANAIATVLLHVATTNLLGLAATYLGDALLTLGLPGFASTAPIADDLQGVLTKLAAGEPDDVGKALWPSLVQAVQTVAPRTIPAMKVHKNYWGRLAQISERLHSGTLIPGLTVHQAKGREWPVVGVRLNVDNVALLSAGLTGEAELERQLYVALTRARLRTIAVP